MTTRRIVSIGLVLAAVGIFARPIETPAQEVLTLATPVFTSAGAVTFRVASLTLKRDDHDMGTVSNAAIVAVMRETVNGDFVAGGRSLSCSYAGATASALIAALNTANLSTTSLEKRVMNRCQQDGQLGAGTVAGTPQ